MKQRQNNLQIPQTENCSGQEKRSSAKQKTGYKEGRERGNSRDLYMDQKRKGNILTALIQFFPLILNVGKISKC